MRSNEDMRLRMPCETRPARPRALPSGGAWWCVIALGFALASWASAQEPRPSWPVDYFRSEEFKKDFLGSYGMRTDIEPYLSTEEEKTRMQELSDLIATNPRQVVRDLMEYITDDTNAQFDFMLANLYFQGGDIDRAAARYHQAIKKFPNFLRAHKNLGMIHFRKGRHAEAIKSLTRAVELGGADGTVLGILGLAYLNTERWLSAESAYRSALLLQPDVADWKLGLARALFSQQKFGEVGALIDELIAQSPDRADYWLLQANAFIGMNQPMKAAQNYEMLIRMNKATPEALNLLGDIYVNEKLYGLAARAYVMGMDVAPDKGLPAGVRAAEILAQRGATTAAKEVARGLRDAGLDQLAAEDKRRLLKTEARVAAAEGAADEAAKVLHEIVDLDPLDGEALLLLGQHYGRKGEPEKAIFMYERAEGIEAFEADAKVRHAQLLVEQGKLEQAVPLLKRAQEVKPRDSVGQFLDQVERIVRRRR